MTEQHTLVVASHTIDRAVEYVPTAAGAVVDEDVCPVFEGHRPTRRHTGDRRSVFLILARLRLAVEAHRHPTVVGQIGHDAEQQVRNAGRRGAPDRALPERAGRADLELRSGQTGHRAHKVRRSIRGRIQAVRGEARNAIFGDHLQFHAIAFRIGTGEEAGTEVTAAILIGCRRVIVARCVVGAPEDRLVKCIADAVAVGVLEAVAIAVVFGLGVNAGSAFHGHQGVIVARRRIHTSGTADVLAAAVVLGGFRIVVAGVLEGTTTAAGEFTRAIVQGGHLIEVACGGIDTARHFQLIAQAVAVDIVEAVAVAIEVVHSELVLRGEAGQRQGGVRIVVAGAFLHASGTALVFAVVDRIAEVAGEFKRAARAGHRRRNTAVSASGHEEVAHTVRVVVRSRVAATGLEITAGRIEDRGLRVVVAGKRDHAAGTAGEFTTAVVVVRAWGKVAGLGVETACIETTAVVEVGLHVKVHSRHIGAASKDTTSIVLRRSRIEVGRGRIDTAHAGHPLTAAVVLRGRGVVVARTWRRTTRHFEFIANAISVVVLVAVAEAIVAGVRKDAGAIVGVGVLVVVARCWIHTAGVQATSVVRGGRGHIVVGRLIGTATIRAAAVVDIGAGREVVGVRIGAALILAQSVGQRRRSVVVVRRRIRAACARRVVANHPTVRGIGIVVACTRHETSCHLIGVADAIAVGVEQAVAVTVHARRGRIGARAVVRVGVLVEVARRVVRATEIGTASVFGVGRGVIIARRRVQTAEVNAVGVAVGLRIVVVRLRIGAAREQAASVVGIGRRIIVVRRRVGATEVNAVGVDVGLRVVVVRIRIGAAAEGTAAIVHVGPGVEVVGRHIGAAEVFAEVVVFQQGRRVVVVRLRIIATRTRQVLAGAVVVRCAVVIARHQIGATRHLAGITNAVAIGIRQALTIAIVFVASVDVRGKLTAAVIGQGRGVVVARRLVRAAEELAGAIVQRGLRIVVGCRFVRASGHHAGAVVDGREWVVVAGRGIGATRENTGAIVLGSLRVVVLRSHNRTTGHDARAIVEVGPGVIVVCIRVGASRENAGVVVRVGRGVVVEGTGIRTTEELAGAIVLRGLRVEVVRREIRTSGDETAAIVVFRRGIVVVGSCVGAAAHRTRGAGEVCGGETGRDAHIVLTVSLDEDLIVQRSGQRTGCCELADQGGEIVTGDAVGVDIGHEPGAPNRVVHDDVAPRIEADDPILVGALGTLDGPLPCAGIRCAGHTDGDPGIISELRECRKEQRVHSTGERASKRVLIKRRGRRHLQRQLLIAIHTRQHVVCMRHRGQHAPSRGAREGAGGVVCHALEAQAITDLVGLVIEAVQSSLAFFGAGAVLAAAIVLRHRRIVVASDRIDATTEFIFITNAIAIGIAQAIAIAVHVRNRGVGARPVVHIGIRIEVASLRVDATAVLTGTVFDGSQHVEVDCSGVHTTGIHTASVGHVGASIIVVRRFIHTAWERTRPVVHIRVRVVVGGRGVRAACILARPVVHVGIGIVVQRTTVQTAREQARSIVIVGRGIVVDRFCVRTTGVQARPVVHVGRRIVVGRLRIQTAFEDARTVVGIGRRVIVGGRLVGTTRKNARAIVSVGVRIEVARHRHRTSVVDAGAVVHVGLRIVVVGLGIKTTQVHAATVVGVGGGIEVVCLRIDTTVVDAGAVVRVGGRIVVVRVSIRTAAEDAGSVVLVGLRIVVVRSGVGATRHNASAIVHVGAAVVVQCIGVGATGEGTGAILKVGVGIVVVGRGVGAAASIAPTACAGADDHGGFGLTESFRGEGECGALLVTACTEGESLDGECATDHAIGGELRHENPEVGIWHAIEVGGRHKPSAAHDVVDADFAAGVKPGDPVLIGALGTLDVAVSRRRRTVQSNGHPAVVGEVRECAEKQGIHAGSKSASEIVLVERRRRCDDHGVGRIAIARAEQVGRIVEHHVHPICGHARKDAVGVRGHPLHVEGITCRIVSERHRGQRVTIDIRRVGRTATATSAVIAGAVLFRSAGVVIAGHHVHAAGQLEFVTRAIAVGIVEAVPRAIEVIHAPSIERILAGAIIDVGTGVVIARHGVGTAAVYTGAVIRVGICIVVGRLGVHASGENAGAIVVIGTNVVIGRIRIGAPRIQAGAVVDCHQRIVVARKGIGTTVEDAGSVVEFRCSVVVGGVAVRTAAIAHNDDTDHAECGLVGHGAVVVVDPGNGEDEGPQTGALRRAQNGRNGERLRVVEGKARQLVRDGIHIVQSTHIGPDHRVAHVEAEHAGVIVETRHFNHSRGRNTAGVEINTATILFGGGGVIVPCGRIGASGDFQFIANPISIAVVETGAGAVLKRRSVNTTAVVVVGGLVKIAGRGVDAPTVQAGAIVGGRSVVVVVGLRVDATAGARTVGALKAQVEAEVALPHAMLEHLNEEGARNLSVRGQLGEQHTLIGIRRSVAVVLRHKPCAARRIVHHNVAAALKRRQPPLGGALHRAHLALARSAVGLLEDADGHPAVVRQFWEESEQQRVHRIGGGCTEAVLIEGRRGGEVQREDGIATDGRDDVVGVHAIHEDLVRGHAGEGAGIVFGNDIHGQAVAGDLGMRKGHCGQAREKSDQTVHVSTIWVGQS